MQMITEALLKKVAPSGKNLAEHAKWLSEAAIANNINTPRRVANFIGQLAVETGYFSTMSENLNYRTPERLDAIFSAVKGTQDARNLIKGGPQAIANRVYANRLGNGSEASGDGWKYRGSGHIQLTGKYNFEKFAKATGIDIVTNPDAMRDIKTSAQVSAKYFAVVGCNALADEGNTSEITERVNGAAKLHLKDRIAATLKALDFLTKK